MEIEKLAAEIGISPETLRSLYRSFLEATPDHLAALKKGITGRDAEAVKTILVVDNNPMVLSFMSEMLTRAGYEVHTADTGLGAFDI